MAELPFSGGYLIGERPRARGAVRFGPLTALTVRGGIIPRARGSLPGLAIALLTQVRCLCVAGAAFPPLEVNTGESLRDL